MNKLKWACVVPLIGGLPLGMMQASGTNPQYILSWKAFANNDKHYVNYLKNKNYKGKYIVVDDEECEWTYDELKNIDIICATPPCAGLSSFATNSCADNPTNDHMLNCTDFVLENCQPKVYYLENAPHLATNKGKKIADKLYEIGQKHGYNFLMFTTESRFHNNPQIRPRTFAFFMKNDYFDDKTYILEDIEKQFIGFKEFLSNMVFKENDPMNVCINSKEIPSENSFYKYAYHKIGQEKSYSEFVETVTAHNDGKAKSFLLTCLSLDTPENILDWMIEQEDVFGERVMKHVINKLSQGKGFWAHGTAVSSEIIPAFIVVQLNHLGHPTEDRYLTLREGMHLMGMPIDFELVVNEGESVTAEANHICQNVPVNTAKNIALCAISLLDKNESKQVNAKYILQRHKYNDYKILDSDIEAINTNKMDDFF